LILASCLELTPREEREGVKGVGSRRRPWKGREVKSPRYGSSERVVLRRGAEVSEGKGRREEAKKKGEGPWEGIEGG